MGKKPDYNLSVLDKNTGLRGRIGAGWVQEDGRISISINPCVTIKGGDPNIIIALFPAEFKRDSWDEDNRSDTERIANDRREAPF